jgi:hypothetical protein
LSLCNRVAFVHVKRNDAPADLDADLDLFRNWLDAPRPDDAIGRTCRDDLSHGSRDRRFASAKRHDAGGDRAGAGDQPDCPS